MEHQRSGTIDFGSGSGTFIVGMLFIVLLCYSKIVCLHAFQISKLNMAVSVTTAWAFAMEANLHSYLLFMIFCKIYVHWFLVFLADILCYFLCYFRLLPKRRVHYVTGFLLRKGF